MLVFPRLEPVIPVTKILTETECDVAQRLESSEGWPISRLWHSLGEHDKTCT